jgi:hypothetical protein
VGGSGRATLGGNSEEFFGAAEGARRKGAGAGGTEQVLGGVRAGGQLGLQDQQGFATRAAEIEKDFFRHQPGRSLSTLPFM